MAVRQGAWKAHFITQDAYGPNSKGGGGADRAIRRFCTTCCTIHPSLATSPSPAKVVASIRAG
ncbi:MAG: hypothetical protein U0992_18085 [Planctomycetaceae bacterium]